MDLRRDMLSLLLVSFLLAMPTFSEISPDADADDESKDNVGGESFARYKTCLSPWCPVCSAVKAVCTTQYLEEVIPENVTRGKLEVTYLNKTHPASLQPHHFGTYRFLARLKLSGDFISIHPDSFRDMYGLKALQLVETRIGSLSDTLFVKNFNLGTLSLIGNQFATIPTHIVLPIHKLFYFQFSHTSVSLPCLDGFPALPLEMSGWEKLNVLIIDGLKVDFGASNCTYNSIGENFFKAASRVTTLSASDADIFHGSQKLLLSMTRLAVLYLTNTSPYKECPASAAELLKNTRNTLKSLHIDYWSIPGVTVNNSCLLTNSGVTSDTLNKFSYLNMKHSFSIIGQSLERSPLSSIIRLGHLDLSYCGIYSLGNTKLPNARKLRLDGNMLSPYDLNFRPRLKSKDSPQFISLRSSGLVSNEKRRLSFADLQSKCPNLLELDIAGNFIEKFPNFAYWPKNSSTGNVVRTLTMDNNNVEAIDIKLCLSLPNLETFNIINNKLKDISGLQGCKSLKRVSFYKNSLGANILQNEKTLSTLTGVIWLDLSTNLIKSFEEEAFYNMVYLEELFLSDNEIYKIDENLFRYNQKLQVIDLSWNSIHSVSSKMFSHLKALRRIRLNGNLISTIDSEFIAFVDTRPSLQLHLADNSFDCKCENKYLQTWLKGQVKVMDKGLTKCSSVHPNEYVLRYEDDHYNCYVKPVLIPVLSVFFGILLAVLLTLFCYKYRWYVTHIGLVAKAVVSQLRQVKLEKKCSYDAFVSYNKEDPSDTEWVVSQLLPSIEESKSRSNNEEQVCIHQSLE